MICTQCDAEIPFTVEDVTVWVVWADGRFELRCHHNPFDQTDPTVVAILGSKTCAEQWFADHEVKPKEQQP